MRTRVEMLSDCMFEVDGVQEKTEVQLTYNMNDPYAITLLFTEHGNKWTFARDLVVNPDLGVGDVQIKNHGRAYGITLRGSNAVGRIFIPVTALNEFLFLTMQLCPLGNEYVNVDAWIKAANESAS